MQKQWRITPDKWCFCIKNGQLFCNSRYVKELRADPEWYVLWCCLLCIYMPAIDRPITMIAGTPAGACMPLGTRSTPALWATPRWRPRWRSRCRTRCSCRPSRISSRTGELQNKCTLFSKFSIENAEIMENCPEKRWFSIEKWPFILQFEVFRAEGAIF